MQVLETRDVTKCFGAGDVRVEALRSVSLAIGPGEFVAIMGPSGSGKSTLLTLLGGVDTPTSGQILLEGTDMAALSDDARTLMRRRRIGFVFQAFNLLPTLSAVENVSLPLELDGVSASKAKERAEKALEQVEMSHRGDHIPGKLSGGEQQRVAIARALAIEPALLLADEPTGNLDSRQTKLVMSLLTRLVEERQQTIVLVTHDPSVGEAAHRLVKLRDGRVESDVRRADAPTLPGAEPAARPEH
ncbi:ABC transporter ATP-binding protein [Lignipirellula cremea]|uniref:Putative ABC transporter ATP-binding protein n=1 Tax=Lignipirellula cremea TaxID=2528010 RepID=A0A518E3H1_9BACT|nr:ABC transporter ATP-binding protein [Lignipirellula cremea]QDU98646.1 putative ABC transporter ATP-binding protein [Lignipirellula cremea]